MTLPRIHHQPTENYYRIHTVATVCNNNPTFKLFPLIPQTHLFVPCSSLYVDIIAG